MHTTNSQDGAWCQERHTVCLAQAPSWIGPTGLSDLLLQPKQVLWTLELWDFLRSNDPAKTHSPWVPTSTV